MIEVLAMSLKVGTESTICFEIQKKLLEKNFDFKRDEEAEECYSAGG